MSGFAGVGRDGVSRACTLSRAAFLALFEVWLGSEGRAALRGALSVRGET